MEPAHGRLPELFDTLDTGVVLHGPGSTEFLDANTAAEEMYGYSSDELREMGVGDICAPTSEFSKERAEGLIREAIDGDGGRFEWRIRRSNGELLWISVRLTPAELDGEEYVLGQVEDITEYKERSRRLNLLTRLIRHNLRNEMNVVMGHADRLRTSLEEGTLEESAQFIHDVAEEIGTFHTYVREIEEIAGRDATQREPTNVGDAVSDIVEEYRRTSPSVTFRIDRRADPWISADGGVQHALREVVQNAVEHNDAPDPSVTVLVDVESELDRAVVRVIDDGPGIPPKEITALDDSIEPSATAHGTGLGLWVIKWCVESLGGQLEFGDNEPRGNVVQVTFPRTPPPGREE